MSPQKEIPLTFEKFCVIFHVTLCRVPFAVLGVDQLTLFMFLLKIRASEQ